MTTGPTTAIEQMPEMRPPRGFRVVGNPASVGTKVMPDTENGLAPQVEELLTAVLRGEAAPWPPNASGEVERRVLNAAGAHGVQALLTHMFYQFGSGAGWPGRALLGSGR